MSTIQLQTFVSSLLVVIVCGSMQRVTAVRPILGGKFSQCSPSVSVSTARPYNSAR